MAQAGPKPGPQEDNHNEPRHDKAQPGVAENCQDRPGERPAQRPRHVHRQVGDTLEGRAAFHLDGFGDQRRPGHDRGGPAQAQEDEADGDGRGGIGTGPCQQQCAEQQHLTREDAGRPSRAVGQPAEHGGEGVHAGNVKADGQTDDGERGAMVAEVHRGHRHQRHHCGVAQCTLTTA
jgi:hypothetical protein